MARFGFERYMTQRKRNIVKILLSILEFKLMSVTVFSPMSTYLKHFLDAFGRDGAILGDIGTEDVVSIWVRLSIFARLVIPQLLKDGLGHVGVKIVDKNVLRHTVSAHFSKSNYNPTNLIINKTLINTNA